MKTFVLYHANCNDGFGAAWVAWLLYGDLAVYLPVKYGEPVPAAVEDGSDVLIVDFSYSRAELEALRERGCKLCVIDHHATAKQELAGLEYAHFDMTRSGAVLTWMWLFPEKPMPELLRYIQDRDLWQWQLPESKEVSAALMLYPREFPVWCELARQIDTLKVEGRVALKVVDQQAQHGARAARPYHVGGYTVPTLNCTCFQSETAHAILELNPEAPFVALYRDDVDAGLRRWSLRSRKDFDCSVIAKQFGGGGHAQACGFEERLPICSEATWREELEGCKAALLLTAEQKAGALREVAALQLAIVRVASLLEPINLTPLRPAEAARITIARSKLAHALGSVEKEDSRGGAENAEKRTFYSYSTNGETYHGEFLTELAAMTEAFEEDEDLQRVDVGHAVRPDLESFVDSQDIIESIIERNEEVFGGDWAEGWCSDVTSLKRERYEELNEALAPELARWVKRHDLQPTFFNVEKTTLYTREQWEELKAKALKEGGAA